MKKITLLAIVIAATSFASCKKDRTCSCTMNVNTVRTGYGASTDNFSFVYTKTIQKSSKGDARANCLSTKYTDVTSGGSGSFAYTDTETTEETCSLK